MQELWVRISFRDRSVAARSPVSKMWRCSVVGKIIMIVLCLVALLMLWLGTN